MNGADTLLRTFAAMMAPCSVKAIGGFRLPPWLELEVAFCIFKFAASSRVRTNAKSTGNRLRFCRTFSFRRFFVSSLVLPRAWRVHETGQFVLWKDCCILFSINGF